VLPFLDDEKKLPNIDEDDDVVFVPELDVDGPKRPLKP